jgi:O-antigen ligase
MALRMSDQKVSNNNLEFTFLLLSFSLILFFSSNYFMSYWWAHAVICILATLFIKRISKYYITWILIINASLFSNQTRFSTEFLLIALGLSAWALSDQYLKTTKNQKIILSMTLITISVIFTLLGKSLNEKYSLLAWLPILVSFYFPVKEKLFQNNNFIATSIAVALTSLSSKKSILLGYFAQYISTLRSIKSRLALAACAIAIFLFSFVFQDDLKNFYGKSIHPRIIIWQASINGFLHKPIGGNGFGIYSMEINSYRKFVYKIGGKLNKHLDHAHNNFLHVAFEQGLIGIGLFLLLLVFLLIHHNPCFWTLITLSIFDANLVYSSQYLLASMIFLPSILDKEPLLDKKFFVLPFKYQNFAYQIILFLCLINFGFSVIGHYHYDNKNYDMAIKFDSEHSLYQFFLGVERYKKNKLAEAIVGFEKSIKLSKNHGFQQGFLAVSYYMLGEKEKAAKWISEGLRLSGNEAQWKYVAHLLYLDIDPSFSKKIKAEALSQDPILSYYDKGLMPPKLSFIGGYQDSYFWIKSYQRRGEKVFLPTPQI